MQSGTDGEQGAGGVELLAAETFRPFLGTEVRVAGFPGPLTLTEVAVVPGRRAGAGEPFILVIAGPPAADRSFRDLLPEGLHRCSFGAGALTADIHVAPIHTPGGGRQDYQAVFS